MKPVAKGIKVCTHQMCGQLTPLPEKMYNRFATGAVSNEHNPLGACKSDVYQRRPIILVSGVLDIVIP